MELLFEDLANYHKLPDKYKKDKKFLLRALKKEDSLMKYMWNDFKDDEDFILNAIKIDPDFIKYFPKQLNDVDFNIKSLDYNKNMHYAATEEILNNKKFALEAVKKSENSFYSLSKTLQTDPDVFLEAIKNPKFHILTYHPLFRKNEAFSKEVVKIRPKLTKLLPKNFIS